MEKLIEHFRETYYSHFRVADYSKQEISISHHILYPRKLEHLIATAVRTSIPVMS
jgi:hypothetical protein